MTDLEIFAQLFGEQTILLPSVKIVHLEEYLGWLKAIDMADPSKIQIWGYLYLANSHYVWRFTKHNQPFDSNWLRLLVYRDVAEFFGMKMLMDIDHCLPLAEVHKRWDQLEVAARMRDEQIHLWAHNQSHQVIMNYSNYEMQIAQIKDGRKIDLSKYPFLWNDFQQRGIIDDTNEEMKNVVYAAIISDQLRGK